MICVHGLLPITFRQSTYNIPVAIWLPLAYPKDAPIVYVVPTSDMLIRGGKHVDLSGMCNPPYLTDWIKKPEVCSSVACRYTDLSSYPFDQACNIRVLAEAMQDIFSREPPLYAKPKANRIVSNPPTAPATPTSIGPANSTPSRPPVPPKPQQSVGSPLGSSILSSQQHAPTVGRAVYVNVSVESAHH